MEAQNTEVTTTTDGSGGALTIAITVMVIVFFVFQIGHALGFNAALNTTFTDDQGRNCIAAKMYIPTESDVVNGHEYGSWPFLNGRGTRIYCEDKQGE